MSQDHKNKFRDAAAADYSGIRVVDEAGMDEVMAHPGFLEALRQAKDVSDKPRPSDGHECVVA